MSSCSSPCDRFGLVRKATAIGKADTSNGVAFGLPLNDAFQTLSSASSGQRGAVRLIIQFHDLLILRHRDVPFHLVADVFRQALRGLFVAVSQEHLSGRRIKMAQPANQSGSVGVPRETVDLVHLCSDAIGPAVDPHLFFPIYDLAPQRSVALIAHKLGSSTLAARYSAVDDV